MKYSKPITYYIGNAFMALSLVLLAYIYFPIFALYFLPHTPSKLTQHQNQYTISIPKLQILSPVVANVDPFDEEAYQDVLHNKGIAHAKGTSLPDGNGTIFLFAHSSDAPWAITQYNTIFFRLSELKPKDTIIIGYQGKTYIYSVAQSREVWPHEVNFLTDTGKKQLILQTCTPIGTSLKRLLVFAQPL